MRYRGRVAGYLRDGVERPGDAVEIKGEFSGALAVEIAPFIVVLKKGRDGIFRVTDFPESVDIALAKRAPAARPHDGSE